jgi:hypothetical protein
MELRHPVRSLAWAVMRAVDQDLAGVDSPTVNELQTTEKGHVTVRPRIEECSVVMFTQAWRRGDLGFGRDGDRDCTEAETVVITGPAGDACVYVATRLLYRIGSPNRRFFLDVAAQCMRGKWGSDIYDGRDSEDQEALDYEVAGALARVCGALRMMQGKDAGRVARMLRECIEHVEAAAQAALPRESVVARVRQT